MNDRPYALPIPYRDPVGAFQPFADDPVAALLDSATEAGDRGRYSYIAADPFQVIRAGRDAPDPFAALAGALKRFPRQNDPALPPFQGGSVGYLGYELGRHLERLPPLPVAGLDVPDMVFGFYDTIAAFDARTQKAWIIALCDSPSRYIHKSNGDG